MSYFKVVLLLLLLPVLSACKQEDKEIVIGQTGEARRNPYLALERYIESAGYEVSSRPGWASIDYETSFVLMPQRALESRGYTELVKEWVGYGNHLVITLHAGESTYNDWKGNQGWFGLGASPPLTEETLRLMENLGIQAEVGKVVGTIEPPETREDGGPSLEPQDRKSRLVTFRGDGVSFQVEVEEGYGFSFPDPGALDFTDDQPDGEHAIVSATYLDGRITFINNARPLRNAFVGDRDHAAFFDYLWGDLAAEGKSVLTFGADISFLSLFWEKAWRFILAALLLLILWLWRWLPRFGPVRREKDPSNRSFLNHVRGWGHFLWKRKAPDTLLEPLRAELMEGYELSQANATELTRLPLMEVFVQRTGLTLDEVIEALTRRDISDPTTLTKVVANLQKMKLSL